MGAEQHIAELEAAVARFGTVTEQQQREIDHLRQDCEQLSLQLDEAQQTAIKALKLAKNNRHELGLNWVGTLAFYLPVAAAILFFLLFGKADSSGFSYAVPDDVPIKVIDLLKVAVAAPAMGILATEVINWLKRQKSV